MKTDANWKFYKPIFEYKHENADGLSPWAGHIYFAYDLMANLKPEVSAELGSYKGTSSFAFTQALKDLEINGPQFYAIDCWEGDEHSGFYGNEIYDLFLSIKKKYYPLQNLFMKKMFFDEALSEFKDKSVDLLHIDGLHTYEAVKHDYESWKPKLKTDGVVLFHDTQVPEFGVRRFWEELKDTEASDFIFFEFKHSNGLGVMISKQNKLAQEFTPETVEEIVAYYQTTAELSRLQSLVDTLTVSRDKLQKKYEDLKITLGSVNSRLTQNEDLITNTRRRFLVKVFNVLLKPFGSKLI